VISLINDLGFFSGLREAPDAETLLMQEAAPDVAGRRGGRGRAGADTVDSEFRRTTARWQVLRDMGSATCLPRGEIEIAKRIEDRLRLMVQAICRAPTPTADSGHGGEVEMDEMRIDELTTVLSKWKPQPQQPRKRWKPKTPPH